MNFVVKDIYTGDFHEWKMEQILNEINMDTSQDWIPYDKDDWEEGWRVWAEGDVYELISYTNT